MCLHSVPNLSPVERVKKCRFSNTNKNQNCTQIALGKNTILLGFGYSTLTFMSKRAPRVWHLLQPCAPRSKIAPGPTTRLGITTTPPSRTPSWPTTAGPLSKASTSTPRTMIHATGTLLGYQRLSSTCTKMQPPGHTASPGFGLQRHNRYRSRTYSPAQQNPQRPRNTNTSPRKKGTTHQSTKGRNPPTPPQLSNNSTSPSPRVTSRTTTNYPERGTTQGAEQRHGDYRRAPLIGRKSSQG